MDNKEMGESIEIDELHGLMYKDLYTYNKFLDSLTKEEVVWLNNLHTEYFDNLRIIGFLDVTDYIVCSKYYSSKEEIVEAIKKYERQFSTKNLIRILYKRICFFIGIRKRI